MGHADLAITARVYAHIFPTEGARVADALDEIATHTPEVGAKATFAHTPGTP